MITKSEGYTSLWKKGLQMLIIYMWAKGALDTKVIKASLISGYHFYLSPYMLCENPEYGIQQACDTILKNLNMNIIVEQKRQLIPNPILYVCNHHSFLDLIILKKIIPETNVIIRKDINQEVFFAFTKIMDYVLTHWKIIPYTQGDSNSGAQVKSRMRECWKSRENVLVFPEGTVRGKMKTPFFPGSFRQAFNEGITIQPITLYYNHNNFCADDGTEPYHLDVLENLKHFAHVQDNRCYLHFHPPVNSAQWTNAKYLQQHCEKIMVKKWQEYVKRDDCHELETVV